MILTQHNPIDIAEALIRLLDDDDARMVQLRSQISFAESNFLKDGHAKISLASARPILEVCVRGNTSRNFSRPERLLTRASISLLNISTLSMLIEENMDASKLKDAAISFNKKLEVVKSSADSEVCWYPYGTLNNFIHLKPFFEDYPLNSLAGSGRILDIGAADGDLAFFLESLGYKLDIVDNPPTNYNHLKGANYLKKHFSSNIEIYEIDLDAYFAMPQARYDLVFFLGILYHLKNPFYVLESLSKTTRHLLLSTRIAKFGPHDQPIMDMSLAYLVGPTECNNDATNFWIFTEVGLKKLCDRTGWDVVQYRNVGDTRTSNPVDANRDERGFALLKSRNFFEDPMQEGAKIQS